MRGMYRVQKRLTVGGNVMAICWDQKSNEEKKRIYRMYQEIFADPEAFAKYYFTYLYPRNRVLMLEEEGCLASMVHLNPYRLVIGGQEIDASYIVAVSTLPQYRRQGMMAKLLKEAFRDLYGRGDLFTYLMPANEAYYTPFDFSFVMDWFKTEPVPLGGEGHSSERSGCQMPAHGRVLERQGEHKGIAAPEKQKNIWELKKVGSALYGEAADYLNGLRRNSFRLWVKADARYIEQQDKEMESEGGGLYLIYENGRKAGFFACTVDGRQFFCTNAWLPAAMEKEEFAKLLRENMGKKEFAVLWQGNRNKREFAGLLRESAGKWELSLTFPGRPSHPSFRAKAAPAIMARIICLSRLLQFIGGEEEGRLCLFVEDRYLPQNHGCFCWQLFKDGSRLLHTEESPAWHIGIGNLVPILFGREGWERQLSDASREVREFFAKIRPIKEISITEQV